MKLVIVDDHPLVRQGLTSILSLDGSMEVLGEATNNQEAIDLFISTNPDLAIVDLRLANESGLDLIQEATRQGVSCKFVVLTSSTEEEDFKRAKDTGVDGYILKEALPEELIQALRIVSKGRKYYDPGIFEFLMSSSDSHKVDSELEDLTPKEMEVLIELGKGCSNHDIANNLFITDYTVKKHVSQILSKLNLHDRTQAALYANAKGLVKYAVH